MALRSTLICAALGLVAAPFSNHAAVPHVIPIDKTSAAALFRDLPLAFEPNWGQAPRGG
jgi:hypothetical protein